MLQYYWVLHHLEKELLIMDKNTKKRMKENISKYMDLSNQRFTDDEVSRLDDIVNNREALNGRTKSYHNSYKTFDSEDTYRVNETDTYTFHSDNSGIRIQHKNIKDWDDGQHDEFNDIANTGRKILNLFGKLK